MRTTAVYGGSARSKTSSIVMVVNELSHSEDAEQLRLCYDDNSLIFFFFFLLIQMAEKLQRVFVTVVVPSVYACEFVSVC